MIQFSFEPEIFLLAADVRLVDLIYLDSPCHASHLTTAMQPPEGAPVNLGKAQVLDSVPKVIKELKFGVLYADHSHLSRKFVADLIANEGLCS